MYDLYKRLLLVRDAPDVEHTYGVLSVGKKIVCQTMEPGTNDVSAPRVPAGFYFCVPHGWEPNSSFRYKRTWALIGEIVSHQPMPGVPRAAVLFHSGARDEHTLGCVLTGVSRGLSRGGPGLINSYVGEAMDVMRKIIGESPFFLTIKER